MAQVDEAIRRRLGLPEGPLPVAPDPEGEYTVQRLEDAAVAAAAPAAWSGPVVVLVESFAVGDNRDLDRDPDPDSPPPPFPAEGEPESEEEVEISSAASALRRTACPPGPLRITPWPASDSDEKDD